ncbi:MAG: transglutaminase family protein [Deltaproteobacteria bacterium]
MIISIRHTTRYSFSSEVFLEPHTVRLRPRSDCTQKLIDFDLAVDPEPSGKADIIDISGNDCVSLWFSGTLTSLTLKTEAMVETLRTNPFDFIITDNSVARLPADYSSDFQFSIKPYLIRSSEPGGKLEDFASSILEETNGDTIKFLSTLNSRIYSDFEQTVRQEGPPFPPEVTLLSGMGTCRDLTLLFMESCRAAGLAARFVSGYREAEMHSTERQLHAWAEIYLPGGGWRGYDPSEGLSVTDSHVALASGVMPEDAAPVTGTFRGDGASAKIEFEIDVTTEK